jgi:hypothetical protein
MKNTKYTFDKMPEYSEKPVYTPGLNAPPVNYNLLINKP